MLVLFAVAIALAVIFPYQDLNEPNLAAGGGANTVANGKPAVVALGDGATLKSDVVATADNAGANADTDGQEGEPEDDLIIMEKGQQLDLEGEQNVDVTTTTTTVELVVEPSESEKDLLIEVLNEEDEQPSDGTVGLFSHQEQEEPANESPQVAEPEDGEDEQVEKTCTSLLQQADIDGNKMLTTSEYLSFLRSLHNSNILSLENLSDEYASLSFGLRLNFLHQQCKCPQALPECCEYEKGVYVGDESASAEFCRTTMEVGLDGKAKR